MAEESSIASRESAPLTPPRRESRTHMDDDQGTSTRSGDKKATFAPDTTKDFSTPPHPFLAYARRVRSFSSPFQLQKTRYLLTFADEATAQAWWALMQSEYSDTIRESPQLFSFRGDRIPSRAWENPKFAHLKEKWTYRQLAEQEKSGRGEGREKQSLSGTRDSITKSPSMPVLREGSSSPELVRDADALEDPFTPKKGAEQQKTDIAQFNITSERIHKSISQSNANINSLIESQQANARATRTMQAGIERLTAQVDELVQRQMAGEEALHEVQSSVDQNATQVRSLVERPQADVSSPSGLQALQAEVFQNAADVKKLLDGQKTARKSMMKMQSALDQQINNQRLLLEQMQALQAANSQNQALIKNIAEVNNARSDKLLSAFEQHTIQTRESMRSNHQDVLAAIRANTATCNHDVIPPPRKVNRRLVGYVYSRNGT